MPASITDKQKQVVEEAYHYLRKVQGNTSGRSVYRTALRKVKRDPHFKDTSVPSDRWVQGFVSELNKKYRNTHTQLSSEEQAKDAPWSLATLANHPLSPEALPAVLRVWRFCVAVGEVFSIRQAIWVARLYGLSDRASYLLDTSLVYAWRERECKTENIEVDTSDLDAALTMNGWELATSHWVNHTKRIKANWEDITSPYMREYGERSDDGFDAAQRAEGYFKSEIGRWHDFNECQDKFEWELQYLYYPEKDEDSPSLLPEYDKYKFSFTDEEAWWVYAHWITFLRNGPNLKHLSLDECIELIKDLREWIQNHPEVKSTIKNSLKGIDYEVRKEGPKYIVPTEIFGKVGLNFEDYDFYGTKLTPEIAKKQGK